MHPLEVRLAAIRRRVHRLLTLHGACWTLAVALSAAVALGLFDYLVRIEDRGVRLIASVALLAAAGWAGWRFLKPALSARFRDVDIALRIERRFPGLNDRLASTVQFLRQAENEPEAGSVALRRAVVMQTGAEVERLDLASVIDPRLARRAGWTAAAAGLLLATLAAVDPSSTRIALTRLVNPFGGPNWPQRNHLRVQEPVTRLAVGETFDVTVIDEQGSKRLPEEVRLHIRYPGDAAPEEVIRMDFRDGAFVYNRPGVRRPFTYRAVGGDDRSMLPIELAVVEPPALESVAVGIHPPQYTGWPEESSPEKAIRALQGSRVSLTGAATKRLASAQVQIDEEPPLEAKIVEDGFGFSLPIRGDDRDFVVHKPGAYRILLEDAEMTGVVGGKEVRYEIRAVADNAPSVIIEQPAANGYVTADAEVPVRVTAKDDLAIREISLVYLRSDQSEQGPLNLSLFLGPDEVLQSIDPAEMLTHRTIDYRWKLADLQLPTGAQLTFHAAAEDYLPQTGQSPPVRLTVVSRDDLENRIVERQSFILNELSRVLKLQRDSRSQVADLQIQMRDVGRMTKNDLDHLQGAEMTQRQVDRGLTSPTEGIPAQIAGLLADLRNNKLDSPDIERRMEGLQEEIDRLAREHLPPISQSLTGAAKGAQARLPADDKQPQAAPPPGDNRQPPDATLREDEPQDGEPQADKAQADSPEKKPASNPRPMPDDPVVQSLDAAGEHQDEVASTLERLLGDLAKGESFARLFREVGQLRNDQETVGRETAEVGRQTLSKDLKDLTPQQQADLKKIAGKQQELARRFDKVQDRMSQMGPQLEKDDPLAADAINDALQQAREQALAGQMQEAGRNVEQNQLGQAQRQQQDAAGKLQELLDTLSNRREQELSRLVKKLREAEQQLAELREKQAALKKKLKQAEQTEDPEDRAKKLERLTREQKQLAEEAQRLARRLERLQAEQAGRSAGKAGQKMAAAGEQGEQGDAQGAEQAAAAAEKDLDDAQQQLAERRKQAEIDLAMEQLAKIADALHSLHDRQKAAIDDLHRLTDLQEEQGKLTRAQLISLQDLSRLEKSLQDEALALAKKLAAAEVFSLALKGAARELDRTADLLSRREVGPPAQSAAESARRRLAQLLASLEDDPQKADGQEQQSDEGGEGNSGQQGDGIPNIAQLKLLKLMQEEINERTKSLAEAHGPEEPLTDAQKQEYTELSEEQGKLAELTLNLSKPSADENADDEPADADPAEMQPDPLPDDEAE